VLASRPDPPTSSYKDKRLQHGQAVLDAPLRRRRGMQRASRIIAQWMREKLHHQMPQ
jgi:hypothetical protein